jgi:hypothetical protein
MHTFRWAIAALALALAPALQLASEDAAEYLESASLFGPAKILVLRLEMSIARGGSEISREVELSLDRSPSGVKSLARIVSPAFLSGMKFLKISATGKADAQWVKTSRGLRRLGETNRSEAVFDSDFTAEDFGSIGASGFDIAFSPERDRDGERAILARPKGAAPYALRLLFFDKGTRLLTGMEYLDAAGATLKRYRVTSIEGRGAEARPAEATMEDLRTGGRTRLRVLSFATPASLPARTFNSASL